MKNIVFVIESLHLGGAEKSLVTLLQNIDFNKYCVDLILFNKGGVLEKNVPVKVQISYLEMPKLSFLERGRYKLKRKLNRKRFHLAQLFWNFIQSKFTLSKKKYDIAIAYNQGFATYYINSFIAADRKIAWLNTDYQKAGYNIEFDYPIYKNFERIIAVSSEAKNSLQTELERINKKLRIDIIKDISDKKVILNNGKCLKNIDFKKEKINIVTVGRLAPYKGIYLAIESCKKLIDKGYAIHWYVVGEGSERGYLEEQIKRMEIANHFTLLGLKENPYPFIKDCDIYVQTSLFEGLGLTVIEASYFNKPIVCTNFPTAHDIIINGETGLIAEMNSDSIISKIELLINNEKLKNRLINNLSKLENKDKELTLQQINLLLG